MNIFELETAVKLAKKGIIICTYDCDETLKFFQERFSEIMDENRLTEKKLGSISNKELKKILKEMRTTNVDKTYYNKKTPNVTSCTFSGLDTPTHEYMRQIRSFYNFIGCPIIFWISKTAETALFLFAPDFMRVRSHTFDFNIEDVKKHSKKFGIKQPELPEEIGFINYWREKTIQSYYYREYKDKKTDEEERKRFDSIREFIKNSNSFLESGMENIREYLRQLLSSEYDADDFIETFVKAKKATMKGRGRTQAFEQSTELIKFYKVIAEVAREFNKLEFANKYDQQYYVLKEEHEKMIS